MTTEGRERRSGPSGAEKRSETIDAVAATTGRSGAADSPPAGDYDLTEQVGHLLRRAYQHHMSLFQQAIPDSQLTTVQFVTLCAVRDLEPCAQSEVVTRTAIDQATLRGVIDRLKARGLLNVYADPNDKRKLRMMLSEQGRKLVEDMVPVARQITEKTYGTLSPGERVALVYLLRKLYAG